MQSYKTELNYFEKIYFDIEENNTVRAIRNTLYSLIDLDSIEKMQKYYKTIRENENLPFKILEGDIDTNESLEGVKTKLISSAIDKLLDYKFL